MYLDTDYTNIVLLDMRCPIAALSRECAQLLSHPMHLSFVVLTSSSRREVALLSGRDKYSCLQVMSHQNTSIFLFLCTFMARLLIPQDRRDIKRERERERDTQRQGILQKWTVSLPVMVRPVDDDNDEDDADAPRRTVRNKHIPDFAYEYVYCICTCMRTSTSFTGYVYIAVRGVFSNARRCINDSSARMETASIGSG